MVVAHGKLVPSRTSWKRYTRFQILDLCMIVSIVGGLAGLGQQEGHALVCVGAGSSICFCVSHRVYTAPSMHFCKTGKDNDSKTLLRLRVMCRFAPANGGQAASGYEASSCQTRPFKSGRIHLPPWWYPGIGVFEHVSARWQIRERTLADTSFWWGSSQISGVFWFPPYGSVEAASPLSL